VKNYSTCPQCNESVKIPEVPVRKNGFLRCSNGHLFSYLPARGGGDKTADLGRRPAAGRPPIDGATATGQIQARTTMARKNAYVAAAKPKALTAWMFEILDKAANYKASDEP